MNTSARGRTYRAIQLGCAAGEGLHPEFAGLGRDLFLAPACFISGSSRGHQCTHPEAVKQIQRSEACFYMYILLTTHLYFLRAAEMCAYLYAVQNRIFRLVILSERHGMDCTRSILLTKRILASQSHVLQRSG